MGLITRTVRTLTAKAQNFQPVPTWQSNVPQPMMLNYQAFAREGYGGNEIVFAAIEELATSAAEPQMVAVNGKETIFQHPILDLLNRPNPFMGRYEMWAAIMMYMAIAGNAYLLKVRAASNRIVQLWLLRPDRVRVVPDAQTFIGHYDYLLGGGSGGGTGYDSIPLAVNDVIHFKTRNPLNDFYGMSPLQVIAPRVDTDNYIRRFIQSYFYNLGVPGGILTVNKKLSDGQLEAVKRQFHNEFGDSRVGEVMVLDNAEASFTATTAQLGQRGLVVPELDEINEARIAMPFGVPLSLIGARLGMSSSSYGNRKSDRESFWDETLAPHYKELDSVLDRDLVPEFSGVTAVRHDLSDVRALQEDDDKKFARWGKAYIEGLVPLETAQNHIGLEVNERKGIYQVPMNSVPTPSQVFEEAIANGEQVPPPRLQERADTNPPTLPEPTSQPAATPAAATNGAHP